MGTAHHAAHDREQAEDDQDDTAGADHEAALDARDGHQPHVLGERALGEPLNIGEMALETMSARRPSPIRLRSTWVLTISPTARMSAVVSVRVTRITMDMEMMAAS